MLWGLLPPSHYRPPTNDIMASQPGTYSGDAPAPSGRRFFGWPSSGAGMSLVYFLGAGFSAAYGLPVMDQFFSAARQSALLKPEERIFLAQLHGRLTL